MLRPELPARGLTLVALARRQVRELALELLIAGEASGVETSLGHGRANGAAGLAGVSTIAEAATRGQGRHVVEDRGRRVFVRPELDLAEAGGVDDPGARG